MKIRELEQVLREGIRAYPGQPQLALLTGDGPLASRVPPEFASAARTLASRRGPSPSKEELIHGYTWF